MIVVVFVTIDLFGVVAVRHGSSSLAKIFVRQQASQEHSVRDEHAPVLSTELYRRHRRPHDEVELLLHGDDGEGLRDVSKHLHAVVLHAVVDHSAVFTPLF